MGHFDSKKLYEALDRKRVERELTWEDVTLEAGVDDDTIVRARRGGPLELQEILALVEWLEARVDHFF